MPRAALSLKVFAFYLWFLCGSLLFAPNLMLSAFAMPQTNEVWLRVVGVLAGALGYYYLLAIRAGLQVFVRHTVFVRASILPIFSGLVLLAGAPPQLVLFALVDLAGALWTHFALRKDLSQAPA